jgi:RNA polymerase sigma-70 factor (ECF subfamily)
VALARLAMPPPARQGDEVDATLVRELLEGSESALAVLYDRHAPVLFATAARIVGDRSLAGEVVQDTFLALWNRADQFDPARGALRAWLLTITHHRAIDSLRRAGRGGGTTPFSSFDREGVDSVTTAEWLTSSGRPIAMAAAEPAPEQLLASGETRVAVLRALASLTAVEREVIELAYAEDLSQSEIAERLGWPIGTVKTRTRRALRRLREILEEPDAPLPSSMDARRLPDGAGAHATLGACAG